MFERNYYQRTVTCISGPGNAVKGKFRLMSRQDADYVKMVYRDYLRSCTGVYAARRAERIRKSGGNGWTEKEWLELIERFGRKCLKCGRQNGLSADHVIPIAKGGLHDISNIQPLCKRCNSSKGTKIIDLRISCRVENGR